jgi:hypothetical protein
VATELAPVAQTWRLSPRLANRLGMADAARALGLTRGGYARTLRRRRA